MDRCLAIMGSTVETLNQPSLTWVLTFVRATRAQVAGDIDRAEQLAAEALKIGTEGGEPDAAIIFGVQVAIVSLQRGTMGELAPFIAQAAADSPGLPAFVAALATAYTEGDRIDEACHLLEELRGRGLRSPQGRELAHGHGVVQRRRRRMSHSPLRRTPVRPPRILGRRVVDDLGPDGGRTGELCPRRPGQRPRPL